MSTTPTPTPKPGTSMPVLTDASMWQMVCVGMDSEPQPREGKTTPEGEPTYSSGCILLMRRKDGSVKPDKSASVNVIQPAAMYEMGERYVAQGRVYVQPYESNNRVAYSITVERLVPLASASASSSASSSSTASASSSSGGGR